MRVFVSNTDEVDGVGIWMALDGFANWCFNVATALITLKFGWHSDDFVTIFITLKVITLLPGLLM